MTYSFGRIQPGEKENCLDIHSEESGGTAVARLRLSDPPGGIFRALSVNYLVDGKFRKADLKKFDGMKFSNPMDCLNRINNEV